MWKKVRVHYIFAQIISLLKITKYFLLNIESLANEDEKTSALIKLFKLLKIFKHLVER